MRRAPTDATFPERYGPWAVVTGAAVGLGAAFAAECALRGLHVALVDRQGAEVREEAARLTRVHGVETRAVEVDLAEPRFWETLEPGLAGCEVGLLVNNAGLGPVARFLEQPLEAHLEVLATNCRAPLELTRRLAAVMAARGRGGIVFVSSLSALQGTPLVAGYAATKAWNLVLAESLGAELGPRGVDVLAVALGATATPGWEASSPDRRALVRLGVLSPRDAATGALDALGRRPLAIPGLGNRLAALVTGRLLPRPLSTRLLARSMARLYPGR